MLIQCYGISIEYLHLIRLLDDKRTEWCRLLMTALKPIDILRSFGGARKIDGKRRKKNLYRKSLITMQNNRC